MCTRARATEAVLHKNPACARRYEGYEGDWLVVFELLEAGAPARLRLTRSGPASLPASNPDLVKEIFVASRTDITGRPLPGFLEQQSMQAG